MGFCKFSEWCKFSHKVNKFERNKDDSITKLEEKVKNLEIKIVELTEKIENCEKANVLDEKFKNLEEKQINLIEESNEKYKCNQCDFTTYYKKGLKIHKKKMHKVYTCTLCDEIFDKIRDFKVHSYNHSSTNTDENRNKCKNCDFDTDCVDSIEVHVGACREQNFDCGLCGKEFKVREDLEIHLNTCEIFECQDCWLRDVNISEMKNHIRGKHSSTTQVNHLKMDREKQHIVSSSSYFLKDL